MSATTSATPATTRRTRDTRGYWRILLAVVAPIGWLATGVTNFFMPYPMGGSVQDNISGIDAHRGVMEAVLAAYPLFLVTFVPGAVALVLALRRTRPVFTAVMGTWYALAGLLAGTYPPIDLVILTGLREGLSRDQVTPLVDGLSGVGYVLIPMFLFITFGRIALGVLFWRANAGPRWLAVLMMVSPFIEFVPLGADLGNLQPALSWIASGIAMTYVSLVLFRMSNDQFDLPPH